MSPHHGIIGVTQETCMHSCHRYQRPKEEEDQAEESSGVEQVKGGSERGRRRRWHQVSRHVNSTLLPHYFQMEEEARRFGSHQSASNEAATSCQLTWVLRIRMVYQQQPAAAAHGGHKQTADEM